MFWIGIASFFLIGVEELFLTGGDAQLLAKVLVVVGVASSAISNRLNSKRTADSNDTQPSSFAIEATSLISLLGGAAMMYVVFIASPVMPYRTQILLISTLVCALAFVAAHLFATRRKTLAS